MSEPRPQGSGPGDRPLPCGRGSPGSLLVVHPRYRAWLAKCRVTSAAVALDLPGEVVSGHPDRHVVRVELRSGTGTRTVYLKREHWVGWRVRLRNARAGFGRVSRSAREAAVLRRLEEAGLPGPQWIAYGEDGRGRAFLLVDELSGAAELRDVLRDSRLSVSDRRRLAARIGRTVAELHDAGFDTPDLSAKHLFVTPGSLSVTPIDWPSARPAAKVEPYTRLRTLANLSASVADGLASPRDRLRVVWAYLRVLRAARGRSDTPRFSAFVRTVAAEVRAVSDRPALREQRQPRPSGRSQRLVWLAGEQAVAVPEVAADWPQPAVCPPFYPNRFEPVANGRPIGIELPGGRQCSLVRFREMYPFGRWLTALRGRVWRSPAARLARLLFHLERFGVDVPPLLAFGQRTPTPLRAESFAVYELPADTPLLGDWLRHPGTAEADRRRVLFHFGAIAHAAHEAGCRVAAGKDVFRVADGGGTLRLLLDPVTGVRRVRRLSPPGRRADLVRALRTLDARLSRTDVARVLRGYQAGAGREDQKRRSIAASVLRQVTG